MKTVTLQIFCVDAKSAGGKPAFLREAPSPDPRSAKKLGPATTGKNRITIFGSKLTALTRWCGGPSGKRSLEDHSHGSIAMRATAYYLTVVVFLDTALEALRDPFRATVIFHLGLCKKSMPGGCVDQSEAPFQRF